MGAAKIRREMVAPPTDTVASAEEREPLGTNICKNIAK